MKTIRKFSVVLSILVLCSFYFQTVDATLPANIAPGDTFIYSVNTWDVPWGELIPPEEAPFDLAEFVFDLSGSTLGVKVMDTYSNGYYMLDFYVELGKSIVIPLPTDDVDPMVTDIFGTEFILEKGVGLAFGSLPGSDMTELIAGTEESFALPFYLNPTAWSDYETELEALGEDPDVTVTVTNEVGSDFAVSVSGTTEESVDITLAASYFREGENAGIFKSISGEVDGDVTGDGTSNHLEVALEFSEKQVNPLPSHTINKNDLVLKLSTAEMDYTVDGFSTSLRSEINSGLAAIQAFVETYEGLDVIKFDVEDVTGCYYNTRIEVLNPETDIMEEAVEELWWNGFTGMPVTDQTGDIPYTSWTPSFGIIPFFAPGITPDWDMWSGPTRTISEINEIVEKALEAFFDEEEVKDLGLDLQAFDSVYQLRESGDIMFFYSEGKVNLDWNADQMEGATEAGIKTTATLSLEISSNSWLAYSKAGLLAGAGGEVSASITATDIPWGSMIEGGSAEETGSIVFSANLELQSDQVSSIPDPEVADPVAGGDPPGGGLTPGFEYISPLLVLTAAVVLLRKRKHH